METFTAKNVILASGGAGQVWKPTTNALICTGDGIAQAYRVGAPLMDMEMVQYHPTTLVENGFLITEGARGEGATLLNSAGERFIRGGVKTDIDGRTPIEGLYAAGEVACVSVHGGNRLGANSLLDTLIFGRRSGEHAAERAKNMPMPRVPESKLREDAAMIDEIVRRDSSG